jgi:exodeoxyribonuclease VII large subunit
MDGFGSPGETPAGIEVKRVSEISRIISQLLDDRRLHDIWVAGEVRDLRRPAKGHLYFSLLELKGTTTYSIPCAMWQSFARELPFEPKNGMHVLVWGSVEVYEPHGKYQLIVRDIHLAGEGEKHIIIERWKEELTREGLFDPARKKEIPRFPARVGIVSSRSGAARHDIENVISRRFPVEILLSPTLVQGEGAHHDIARAIRRIDGLVDVLIVGRGGGSFDDLFAFNHPEVIRAIAACKTPVVSAVGHEVDVTLSDFAADRRAPTPSAAAELVVPDRRELFLELKVLSDRLFRAMEKTLRYAVQHLEDLRLRIMPRRFVRLIKDESTRLSEICDRLMRVTDAYMKHARLQLEQLKAQLEGANPRKPLTKGYGIIVKEGHIITRSYDLQPDDQISIHMEDGTVSARVEEVDHGKTL